MEGRKVQGAHEQFGMAPSAEVGVRNGKWLDCLGVR